ncbi:beta-lactamase/transpeptidase-like protein [Echria macrotheca]|uniref:Beta-lactamase/transpeptidase-like protein n=1 Tax=Echria macrotheca TaxID=438768 RepID=A0AAJ0BAJ7_9PEZI|nr:beta-lactamase/transpeptidase-like protein [Echria macrotheca]
MHPPTTLLTLTSLLLIPPIQACHTTSPLPRPQLQLQLQSQSPLSSSTQPFNKALNSLTKSLDAALANKIRPGFDIYNVSFSIGITSFDQADPSVPVWEYHHLSPAANRNGTGTREIGRGAEYLIGSISKVLTDALLLKSGINYDDPITKYLPALKSNKSSINWEDITLRSLAGQVAGIVPNYGFSEYYYLKDYFEYLGFPALDNSSYPECGVTGMDGGVCNREQLLRGMLTSDPVAAPQTHPVYSNVAFTLLAYAVEAYTGKTYAQLIRELSAALGMPSTRPSPGNDSRAVIPGVPNNWGSDYGDGAAGGGLVSTVADLSSFLHAILSRSPALSTPTKIRAWLKPHTFIGSTAFQGSPWEIFRPDPALLFPSSSDKKHTVTIIGKDGVAYNYRSRISLLDDYGLGITILTAGDQSALPVLFNAVISTVVPAIDATAIEQAAERYAGDYASTSANATITLDGNTLRLAGLTRGGKDILAGLGEIYKYSLAPLLAAEMARTNGVYRLYPAEIERLETLDDGRVVIKEDWRFEWGLDGVNPEAETDLPGRGISEEECKSWKLVDWLYYGGQSVDRLVFVRDKKTGEAIGMEVPFLRTRLLTRQAA